MKPLRVNTSVAFSTAQHCDLLNHHFYRVLKHFNCSKVKPLPVKHFSPLLTLLSPWQPLIYVPSL